MNKKLMYALIIGIMCAGLVCLVVGLIVRFCVTDVIALLVSIFTIIFGSLMAGFALLVLLVMLILSAVTKSKNEKE